MSNIVRDFFEQEIYLKRRLRIQRLHNSAELLNYYKKDFFKEHINVELLNKFNSELKAERRVLLKLGYTEYIKFNKLHFCGLDFKSLEKKTPFFETYIPILRIAQNQVKVAFQQLNLVSKNENCYKEILLSFYKNLLTKLVDVSSQVYLREFHKKRNKGNLLLALLEVQKTEKYEYLNFIQWFNAGGEISIHKKYSLLSHFIYNSICNWANNITTLIQRIIKDYTIINEYFELENAKIKKVTLGLSDPHHNGQTVSIVYFANNKKIVYKPKDISIDKGYNDFLKWLNQNFKCAFFSYKILPLKDYGWSEYIPHKSCSTKNEVALYYNNAGKLLCLLHFLKATDCHFENIIAHGDKIILIDTETLFTPVSKLFFDGFDKKELNHPLLDQLSKSVLATCLLPRWQYNKNNKVVYDVSGLGAIDAFERGSIIKWRNINTDSMSCFEGKVKIKLKKNVVLLNGVKQQPVYYQDEIINGFTQLYRLLSEKENLIKNKLIDFFSGKQTRFLFRPTSYYYLLKRNLFSPNVQEEKVKICLQLENLAKVLLKEPNPEKYWSLYKAELGQLLTLNIPSFYSRTTKKVLYNHIFITKNILQEDGFKNVLGNNLTNTDMDFQILLIRASFQAYSTKNEWKRYKRNNRIYFSSKKSEPYSILKTIDKNISTQFFKYNEEVRWLGLTNVAQTECLQLQPLNNSIYDGCLGISLFKLEYAKLFNDKINTELAIKTLEPLVSLLNSIKQSNWKTVIDKYGIGIGNGVGSFIYGLSQVYNYLKSDRYIYCCEKLIHYLSNDDIRADAKNDILSGNAGLLLALLKNYAVTQNKKALSLATECGNSLLKSQINKGQWITIDEKTTIAGFAHGLSGIAYSLMKLYEKTSLDKFKKSALTTIVSENSYFSKREFKWRDNRKGAVEKFKDAWCHGTAGIGLTRLYFDKLFPSDVLKRDILAARNSILNYPLNSVDHICCGNFGRLEFLYEYSKHVSDFKDFRTTYELLLNRINETGILLTPAKTMYNNPVLFKGLAGIGYQIIRFEGETNAGSLLLFE